MSEDLETLIDRVRRLRASVQASKAVNINKASIRNGAKTIVQMYFRDVRSGASQFIEKSKLAELDAKMQRLLLLTNGRNVRKSYITVLRDIIAAGDAAHFDVVKGRSEQQAERLAANQFTAVEEQIHRTLAAMLPSAASAYRQAVTDLSVERFSYRGPAIDLREALREVLDHMAPDNAVTKAVGFRLEGDAKGPTMAQKARYIMRQRETIDALARPTLDSTGLVDALTAKIVRSTYVSGSVSVHVAPTKGDVQQLKLHVDSVLAQLLGIYVGSDAR
jgi:Predicted pPIWI-associating nuclease